MQWNASIFESFRRAPWWFVYNSCCVMWGTCILKQNKCLICHDVCHGTLQCWADTVLLMGNKSSVSCSFVFMSSIGVPWEKWPLTYHYVFNAVIFVNLLHHLVKCSCKIGIFVLYYILIHKQEKSCSCLDSRNHERQTCFFCWNGTFQFLKFLKWNCLWNDTELKTKIHQVIFPNS